MRRTIEKLAQDRHDQREKLQAKLAEIIRLSEDLGRIQSRLPSLPREPKKSLFRGVRPSGVASGELLNALAGTTAAVKALTDAVAAVAELQDGLADARDREWDALGSNHVGMIFKSLEWRIDRLAEAYEDASALMKTFILLEERLGRLLAAVEEKKLPSPVSVREILEPIEDWRYLRFENRFRGAPEEVKRRQAGYVGLFPSPGLVLDLGCGRGEFLEALRESGRVGTGVDLNAEMVGVCRDKGLDAVQGDLLEALANRPDRSLGGIFAAQVIEHLPPAYLRRLVELSRAKLAAGGVLVLETVNPLSVFALVQIYFLDMSHRLPVHPQALKFLMEAAGFDEVEIRPVGELGEEKLETLPGADGIASLLNRNIDRLNELLYAAPAYAAVGRIRAL
jgi:O-antigen chain-terminating methyltransferase